MRQALTYDDIQLIPNHSDVQTRQDIKLATAVSKNWSIDIPIVGSCMDTVTEYEMAATLMEMGGVGCIHRFMSIEEQVQQVKKLASFRDSEITLSHLPIMAAVGVVGDYLDRAAALEEAGCNIILVDVAHGHHANMEVALAELKANLEEIKIKSDCKREQVAHQIRNLSFSAQKTKTWFQWSKNRCSKLTSLFQINHLFQET